MVKRFLQIKDAAKHVEVVEELVPELAKLEKLQEDLQALDSICLTLQSNETTLADVRVLFDGVVKRYPEMSNYLAKDATIVHSPTFETAVVKVMRDDGTLTCAEAAAISPLRVGESLTNEVEPDSSATFAATLLHAGSKRSHAIANKVLTPQRSSMLPVNFEMIMFLKENDSYWSRRTIAEVQQSSIDMDTISGN
ncbi:LOW QUALITY PROTEIN: Hypothetical protein PHPALM_4628 [Phytophthora palmivora]|uniref:Uncharacterized protein n=1 Tax=Phytophthora palmivora TaxID=4796 RepID=A0A2P4YJC5_9STRA|nr:LOW QUALITY PROTEIN: Hypothetical protein PHPALM_4628 [Phytophthora palmivora]